MSTTTTQRKPTRKRSRQGDRQARAVADYLALISEPAKLIDWEKVGEIQQQLETCEDPVERLRLRTEMEALGTPDAEAIEAGFIEHGKAWADKNGVGLGAFAAEGVEARILRRAGFPVPRQSRKRASRNGNG